MAKCNICGRKTWFFQSSQCECRAKLNKGKSLDTHLVTLPYSVQVQTKHLPRAMGKTTSQQRPTQSTDMADLYLLQQQQNLINASFSDPEPCKSPSSSHDASPSYQHSSDSNSCNSSSSWDSGSDSSSSYSGD